MTLYLVSFPSRAMDVPDEELPAVAAASHAAVAEAKEAGVLVFAGGLDEMVAPVVVAVDGSVTEGGYPDTKGLSGGFTILDTPSREEALTWAGRIAAACRCDQEVREFMPDEEV